MGVSDEPQLHQDLASDQMRASAGLRFNVRLDLWQTSDRERYATIGGRLFPTFCGAFKGVGELEEF